MLGKHGLDVTAAKYSKLITNHPDMAGLRYNEDLNEVIRKAFRGFGLEIAEGLLTEFAESGIFDEEDEQGCRKTIDEIKMLQDRI